MSNSVIGAFIRTTLCLSINSALGDAQGEGAMPRNVSVANDFIQEMIEQHDARMKWWREARFGMFVHWGLFSAAGGTWKEKPCSFLGCWMQQNFKIPVEEYRSVLMPKFTGERFNADFIARLAQEAGMKYIVPITKHHEGFCLFDSKTTDFKITNTPAKREIGRAHV